MKKKLREGVEHEATLEKEWSKHKQNKTNEKQKSKNLLLLENFPFFSPFLNHSKYED